MRIQQRVLKHLTKVKTKIKKEELTTLPAAIGSNAEKKL
jgi:hypothetical protein